MIKKRKALLIAALVALAAGTSTAAAMVINNPSSQSQGGGADAAVYYEWGSGGNLGDIGELKAGTYVYRKAVVGAPSVSTSLEDQHCYVTFTLSATEDTPTESYSMAGITVDILKDADFPDSGTPSGMETLSTSKTTWADNYAAKGATSHYYSLRVKFDDKAAEEGKITSANLNIALSVAAAPAA